MVTFSGGDKLEAALRKIAEGLSKPGTVRVGFLSDAKYPDGKSVAMIAAINEYGRKFKKKDGTTGFQPPRPFFRNMIDAEKGGWPNAVASELKRLHYDVPKTLDSIGQLLQGQLKQSISTLVTPPLAASTIRRKGFDKPLIGGGPSGGFMLSRVDYEVKS